MKLVLAGAAVVLALVGIVALFIANEILASCLFTLTIAVLTAATIGAATAGPPGSVFLIGFALFGWIYFLVHFSPFGLAFSAYGGAGTAPRLLTSTLIVTAQDWLHPQSNVTMPGATVAWNNYPQDPAASSFQIIAHSQLILIAGVIGGLLGRVFASKRKPET